MTVEGIVSLAVGFVVLSQFGSAGSAFDFTIEKVFIVPVALVVMMIIHGLWSWATAPRRIFSEQQSEIREQRLTIENLSRTTTSVHEEVASAEPAHIVAIRDKLTKYAHEFSPEASMLRGTRFAPPGELTPKDELLTFLRSTFSDSIVSECEGYFVVVDCGGGLPQGKVSTFLQGLADSMSQELIDKHGRSVGDSNKRVNAACRTILAIAAIIDTDTDWKQETKRRLRAVAKDDVCRDYEKILRLKNPSRSANGFLEDLAATLSIGHLR